MIDQAQLREELSKAGLDGWLLFDFHGLNPVVSRVLGLTGMNTRRLFVLLPREGEPVAVAHKIELQAMEGFPGRVIPYARWGELHAALESLVRGRTLAMEISPEDAVPYLDRVPYGVVELLRRLGATVVPSGSLVSRFAARWSPPEARDHRAAAEILAAVARETLTRTVGQVGEGLTESALQASVVEGGRRPADWSSTTSRSWRSAPTRPSHTTSRIPGATPPFEAGTSFSSISGPAGAARRFSPTRPGSGSPGAGRRSR